MPVAEDTAKRVIETIRRLEFSPNVAARNLASKTHQHHRLITSNDQRVFFAPLLNGIDYA
jgi:DNA-binding LacI/PurR family transcriptional regulator